MDHQQWRNQEHEQVEPSAKAPKLQDKTTKMGSLFSWEQWQELELQALIYKYILAGVSVPLELILPLKRGLVCATPCYPFHHFQPAMVHGGYWGRTRYVLEPEPGRCRRTDGKKWRCSRDVVDGQKYCERHVHRGRNRSRKHVEIPTPTPESSSSVCKATPLPFVEENREARFTLPGWCLSSTPNIPSPNDHKIVDGFCCSMFAPTETQEDRPDNQVLMRFFDDWPRSTEHEPAATNIKNAATSYNSFSDFSLKLSTGDGDEQPHAQSAVSNRFGWENHGEDSMGDPLAEAFRSSSSS